MLIHQALSTYVTIEIRGELSPDSTVTIEIISHQGYMMMRYSGTLHHANKILNERIITFDSGVYLVRVVSGQQSYVQKFLKI